jgi:hypothetical protein
MRSNIISLLAFAILGLMSVAGRAEAAPIYTDVLGREWRQVAETVGLEWLAVSSRCPTDGITPCAGSLAGVSLDGWIWADVYQVGELFREFGDHPGGIKSVRVDNAVSRAAYFIDNVFEKTYSDNVFRWVAGWTSTRTPGGAVWVAEVIDKYPGDPNSDIWTTADNFGPGVHPNVGLWMWRDGATVEEPTPLVLLGLAFGALAVVRRRAH